MRYTRKAVLAGMSALALAGTAATAAPAPERFNVMNVSLPDGSVARIHYQGDTPPRVTIAEVPVRFAPVAFGRIDARPFAMFERIAAEMNRRMAAMMRLMTMAPPIAPDGAPGLRLVGGGEAPANGYSFVSRSVRMGGCTRTVQMMRAGAQAEPQVVTRTSGTCGGAAEEPAPAPAVDLRRTI